MKVWRFYKIPSEELIEESHISNYSLRDTYPLYAITNKKKLAKRFMEERDMSKFIVNADHSFEELEQYSTYANRHRSCVLEEYNLSSTDRKTGKVSKVNLVITYNERQQIEEPDTFFFSEEFWNDIFTPTKIFKDKYLEALRNFTLLQKLYAPDLSLYYGLSSEDDDYDAPDGFSYDEISLFVNLYGDTLKL